MSPPQPPPPEDERECRRQLLRAMQPNFRALILVTSTANKCSTADALINEAEFFHLGRIEQIAAIEHDWMRQGFSSPVQIQFFELVPFSCDYECIAALGHF